MDENGGKAKETVGGKMPGKMDGNKQKGDPSNKKFPKGKYVAPPKNIYVKWMEETKVSRHWPFGQQERKIGRSGISRQIGTQPLWMRPFGDWGPFAFAKTIDTFWPRHRPIWVGEMDFSLGLAKRIRPNWKSFITKNSESINNFYCSILLAINLAIISGYYLSHFICLLIWPIAFHAISPSSLAIDPISN
jgi:hypothetical protein